MYAHRNSIRKDTVSGAGTNPLERVAVRLRTLFKEFF
jgi:hypothetical protein